jgi:elongation factor Ts
MAEVTMQDIQELRAKTNCGIMDCKKALKDASNDMEQAIDILRKKGIAKAAKRSAREATEGVVDISVNDKNNKAYILKLCSETDFVSRNDSFQKLAAEIMDAMVSSNSVLDLEAVKTLELASGIKAEQAVDELSGVLGEKIDLADALSVETKDGESIGYYIHSNQKIGVIVIAQMNDKELLKQICMHIAASSPIYVSKNDVSKDELDRERAILKEQSMNEGKSEEIAEKVVEGKLRKYYEEICLLEQNFVIDPDKKISDILGENIISKFIKFNIG